MVFINIPQTFECELNMHAYHFKSYGTYVCKTVHYSIEEVGHASLVM